MNLEANNLPVTVERDQTNSLEKFSDAGLTAEQINSPGGAFMSAFIEYLLSLDSSGKFTKWNIFTERGLPNQDSQTKFYKYFCTINGAPLMSEAKGLANDLMNSSDEGKENILNVTLVKNAEGEDIFRLTLETTWLGTPSIYTFEKSVDGEKEYITIKTKQPSVIKKQLTDQDAKQ